MQHPVLSSPFFFSHICLPVSTSLLCSSLLAQKPLHILTLPRRVVKKWAQFDVSAQLCTLQEPEAIQHRMLYPQSAAAGPPPAGLYSLDVPLGNFSGPESRSLMRHKQLLKPRPGWTMEFEKAKMNDSAALREKRQRFLQGVH